MTTNPILLLPTTPIPYPNDWAIASLPAEELAAREQARVQLMGEPGGLRSVPMTRATAVHRQGEPSASLSVVRPGA